MLKFFKKNTRKPWENWFHEVLHEKLPLKRQFLPETEKIPFFSNFCSFRMEYGITEMKISRNSDVRIV